MWAVYQVSAVMWAEHIAADEAAVRIQACWRGSFCRRNNPVVARHLSSKRELVAEPAAAVAGDEAEQAAAAARIQAHQRGKQARRAGGPGLKTAEAEAVPTIPHTPQTPTEHFSESTKAHDALRLHACCCIFLHSIFFFLTQEPVGLFSHARISRANWPGAVDFLERRVLAELARD